MLRRGIIILTTVGLLVACTTAPPEELSREAAERGFTVVEGSYRSPKGDTRAEVGVLVGACTGTFYKISADGTAYLKVYNRESGVLIDEVTNPNLKSVLGTPPSMTACEPSEASASPAPTSTTAR